MIVFSLVLFCCGGCFSYAQFSSPSSIPEVQKIELYNPLQAVFALLQRINPLINRSLHGAAEQAVLVIPHETIVRFLAESKDFDEFYRNIRVAIVGSLIERQYPLFVTQPYQENGQIVVENGDFVVRKAITWQDSLDVLLSSKLALFKNDFVQIKKLKKHVLFTTIDITSEEYDVLREVFLFKTEQDLRDL